MSHRVRRPSPARTRRPASHRSHPGLAKRAAFGASVLALVAAAACSAPPTAPTGSATVRLNNARGPADSTKGRDSTATPNGGYENPTA